MSAGAYRLSLLIQNNTLLFKWSDCMKSLLSRNNFSLFKFSKKKEERNYKLNMVVIFIVPFFHSLAINRLRFKDIEVMHSQWRVYLLMFDSKVYQRHRRCPVHVSLSTWLFPVCLKCSIISTNTNSGQKTPILFGSSDVKVTMATALTNYVSSFTLFCLCPCDIQV